MSKQSEIRQAKRLIRAGQFIAAVKFIREAWNMPIREALETCEQWQAALKQPAAPAQNADLR